MYSSAIKRLGLRKSKHYYYKTAQINLGKCPSHGEMPDFFLILR